MNAAIDELGRRGLIAHSTDPDALSLDMDAGPLTFYVGFDPTAPSIHMGNLVQIMVVRAMQRGGHRPLLLVGGSTGLIGDPKAAGERRMNPRDVVHEWAERIQGQLGRLVDFEGPAAARMVNNYDWTSTLSTLDYLRDVGKHFSVNRMLDREVVKSRLESGISYTEFSYVLLQSLDYRELYRRYGCTLQTGGSDQWGNLTAGVELIRRSDQGRVHALATPLVTKADGSKFGKTEAGTVWLDPAMTSPYAFHQFFLHAEDSKVIEYVKIFTERSEAEVAELAELMQDKPHLRAAQRVLADDVTDLVHSPQERQAAVAAASAIFGRGELDDLPESTVRDVVTELGRHQLPVSEDPPTIIDALVAAGIVSSRSQARRTIEEGGAYVKNRRVDSVDATVTNDDLLFGRYLVLRRGKKTAGAVELVRD